MLNIGKKFHDFKIICQPEFLSGRSLKTYWINYCIMYRYIPRWHYKSEFLLIFFPVKCEQKFARSQLQTWTSNIFYFLRKEKTFRRSDKKLNSIQLSKDVSWNPLWYIIRQLRQKIESSIRQILCSLRQINFSTLNTKNPYLYTL